MRYTETVMDHFMNPRNCGQLRDADGVGTIGSEECGDMLRVWIKIGNGKLEKVTHEVFGCPAAIASCSMMTELATGLTLQQALELTDHDVANALGGLPEPKYHCSNLAASALHNAIDNYIQTQNSPANTVKITTLVNNTMPAPLKSEHGLSFWIEFAGKNILFDTGRSDAIIRNAEFLDIDLTKTDIVVLSHGHYDHTGGLCAVLELAPDAQVYLHPDAARIRYSCHRGKAPKEISMPHAACEKLGTLFPKGRIFFTAKPHTIAPNLTITGAIPRTNNFEDTGGPFYLEDDCRSADPLTDDQALLITTPKGLVVILGCSHAGIVNTLNYAASLTQQPIRTVIGGMHLGSASQDRLSKTIEAIHRFNVQHLIPCHCTGDAAATELQKHFPNAFHAIHSSIHITI